MANIAEEFKNNLEKDIASGSTSPYSGFLLTKTGNIFVDTKKAIRIVLEFVERYNKQDKEVDVALAAEFLEETIKDIDTLVESLKDK